MKIRLPRPAGDMAALFVAGVCRRGRSSRLDPHPKANQFLIHPPAIRSSGELEIGWSTVDKTGIMPIARQNAQGLGIAVLFPLSRHDFAPFGFNQFSTSSTTQKNHVKTGEKLTLSPVCTAVCGAAGRNRTHDPLVRSQVLYPAELQPRRTRIIAQRQLLFQSFLHLSSHSFQIRCCWTTDRVP